MPLIRAGLGIAAVVALLVVLLVRSLVIEPLEPFVEPWGDI